MPTACAPCWKRCATGDANYGTIVSAALQFGVACIWLRQAGHAQGLERHRGSGCPALKPVCCAGAAQILSEGVPESVQVADAAWKPAAPKRVQG